MRSTDRSTDPVTIVVPRDVAIVFESWAYKLEKADFPGFAAHDACAVLKLLGLFEKQLPESLLEDYDVILAEAQRSLRQQVDVDAK